MRNLFLAGTLSLIFSALPLSASANASLDEGGPHCLVSYSRGHMQGEYTTLLYKRVTEEPSRMLEITCTRRPGGAADLLVRIPLAEGERVPLQGEYRIGGNGFSNAHVEMQGTTLSQGLLVVNIHGGLTRIAFDVRDPEGQGFSRVRITL